MKKRLAASGKVKARVATVLALRLCEQAAARAFSD